MQTTTYTNRSNANRAGKKQFGEGNFTVQATEDGKFAIVANAPAAQAEPEAPAVVAPVAQPEAPTATEALDAADAALADGVAGMVLAHEAITEARSVFNNPFGSSTAALEAAARLQANTQGRAHSLSDEPGEDEPTAPAPKQAAPRKYSIAKERPTAHGITRPSPGTKCGDVWDACDTLAEQHGGAANVTPAMLKAWATAQGANVNNATIELYQWRKHNGITGRAKAAA